MDRIRTKIVTQALQLFEGNQPVEKIKEIMPILFPNENKTNIKILVEKSIEMCCSLNEAVNEAGGSGYSSDMLCEERVIDLIQVLSVNNVRFIYTRRKRKKNKLKDLEDFANEMLHDFEEQLRGSTDNIIAAFAVDVYKEIIEKIKE